MGGAGGGEGAPPIIAHPPLPIIAVRPQVIGDMKPCTACKRGKKGPLFCRGRRAHTAPDWDWDGNADATPPHIESGRAPPPSSALCTRISQAGEWNCTICAQVRVSAEVVWKCPLNPNHRICRGCWKHMTALAARPLGAPGRGREKECGVVMRCWGGDGECLHVVDDAALTSIVGPLVASAWRRGRDSKGAMLRGLAEGHYSFACASCGTVASLPMEDLCTRFHTCECGASTCMDPRCQGEMTDADMIACPSDEGSAAPHASCEAPSRRRGLTRDEAAALLRAPLELDVEFDMPRFEAIECLARHSLRAWSAATACPYCGSVLPDSGRASALQPRCAQCGARWCRSCADDECRCPPSIPGDGAWPEALVCRRLRAIRELAGERPFDTFVRAIGDVWSPGIAEAWPSWPRPPPETSINGVESLVDAIFER